MSSLKKFVGDYAYSYIKNIAVDPDKLRHALVTPRNARNVFSGLDEFQIKSLCAEISEDNTFGIVRKTTQDEIAADFKNAGYDTVIFDDEEKIAACKKYYAPGEVICTYNNLSARMNQYHMIVAIKKDIDKIQRSKSPSRDDEYGTSILNIQIAKNGSHMSIKNRYNHKVSECDSTLNNNLDMLIPGLQAKVLGYYNIACLHKEKKHYPSIVDINGIYLRYEAEKNNIYFGDFVLDNQNGARFEDGSRYYINCQSDTPFVLDFHNKEVIKIFIQAWEISKRPLLTRAMKENLLHSGNKERADTLNIIFPNALKELLQCRRSALRYIANRYGYDFQKPFQVTGLLGTFTAKSIEKNTGSNNGILLFCKDSEVKCIELNRGIFKIDSKNGYGYNISHFYTKYSFESFRKSGTAGVFIIQQDKQYRRKVPEIFYEPYCIHDDIFDKSGCNITETRSQLQVRLRKYKENKRKKEVDAISFKEDLNDIKKMFLKLKEEFILKFNNAKTYKEYKVLNEIVDYDFLWIVRDIENLEHKVIMNGFESINDASNSIEVLKSNIANKMKLLETENNAEN